MSAADSPQTSTFVQEMVSLTRDPVFYRADGDCILRVEDSLFKIHRYLLARDSAVFSGMFDLPQNSADGAQGSSDENPVVLEGDKAEDFGALCWALYALPTELHQQTTDQADLSKLVSVANLANKYSFSSFEEWCLDRIYSFCSEETGHGYVCEECPESMYEKLFDVAMLSNHLKLREIVEEQWAERIAERDERFSLRFALGIGRKYGLRRFQGVLYNQELDRLSTVTSSTNSTALPFAPNDLSPIQIHRFLSGYHSLSIYWRRLLAAPPPLGACTTCEPATHEGQCLPAWGDLWSKIAVASSVTVQDSQESLLGPLEWLGVLHSNCDMTWLSNSPCRNCGLLANAIIKSLIDELDRTMADHFLGPAPANEDGLR